MIGRADIEESKSNVAMNAWLPQASYPCGNFSDTSSVKFLQTKGSIGHAFAVCIRTENQNQVSFYPFILHEISVLIELTLGHLCYRLTDVPPQPNSPPENVFKQKIMEKEDYILLHYSSKNWQFFEGFRWQVYSFLMQMGQVFPFEFHYFGLNQQSLF